MMSGYDAVVAPLEGNVIESKAFAWRSALATIPEVEEFLRKMKADKTKR
jgi:hypothetical protein